MDTLNKLSIAMSLTAGTVDLDSEISELEYGIEKLERALASQSLADDLPQAVAEKTLEHLRTLVDALTLAQTAQAVLHSMYAI